MNLVNAEFCDFSDFDEFCGLCEFCDQQCEDATNSEKMMMKMMTIVGWQLLESCGLGWLEEELGFKASEASLV